MKRSRKTRLAWISAGVMLLGFGLNFGVATRRARALTQHTVTTNADSGPGSLRDAVASSADGDAIVFNLALPATISLTSGEIPILSSITIAGPGAISLTIDGGHLSRIFDIANNRTVIITGVTIADGNTGAIGSGGAIDNAGNLSVSSCWFIGNTANDSGGAIDNEGTALFATNCTFNLNSSGTGGAIANIDGTLSAINCTFSHNTAPFGAAIETESTGNATITNCTISASSGSGIVALSATLNMVNTIVADSIGGSDCASSVPLGLNSHNLIKDGSCSPMLSGDPKLGPLDFNGGQTPTIALLAGSPAIDAGDDSVLGIPLSLTTDQRGPGFPRKSGLHVDIGAFELQQAGPPPSQFDTCLKDNTTGNLIQWNHTTGQYQFTRCSDGFTLTGTGTVAFVNGIRTLTDFKSDRRISAGFNTGQLTGNAAIYLRVAQGVWQTFRIVDTNPSAVCKC